MNISKGILEEIKKTINLRDVLEETLKQKRENEERERQEKINKIKQEKIDLFFDAIQARDLKDLNVKDGKCPDTIYLNIDNNGFLLHDYSSNKTRPNGLYYLFGGEEIYTSMGNYDNEQLLLLFSMNDLEKERYDLINELMDILSTYIRTKIYIDSLNEQLLGKIPDCLINERHQKKYDDLS